MLIVLGLAWAYDRYGTTREAGAIMEGVAPVVIAIVVHAIWKLGRTAIRDAMLAAACAIALALYFSGVNALILIFGTGLAIALARNVPSLRRPGARAIAPWLFPVPLLAAATHEVAVTYGRLFLTFLKIGAVLFGSGYVLLAFLRADFVENLGWLTNRQLLDAIAIGQVTPGPVFTTATFVGYLVLGVPGALVATLGIFLPSFAFVALTAPVLRRLRSSRWLGAGLDGVTVAAIALMIGVTWQLGLDAIVDVPTAAIAVLAGAAVFLWKPNTVWLVLAGGVAGLLLDALR
jgi:chromate transporter